ncbi:MAG TPA: deaminase [Candidatus Dojkabacteria bacterium]|nr:deaminase [Candidatus Dojkabacteria bacterium]
MILKIDKNQLSQIDIKCLEIAIKEAQKSFYLGSYPVGSVLLLNETEIFSAGNTAQIKNNLFFHAENSLIEKYGSKMYECFKNKQSIKLYSTLEPCLMCLGAAIMNKVNEIFFVQHDPHAGACNIDIKALGIRYSENMPIIKHVAYSDIPYKLLIEFFNSEISKGNPWGKKMLEIYEKS